MAHYLNNMDLLIELKECRKRGACSSKLAGYFLLIAVNSNRKLRYSDPMDREDCIAEALHDMVRYWDRFDPNRGSNAFGYFTQIAKFGMAKGWAKLHPEKYRDTLSMDRYWNDIELANYKTI